MLYIKIKLNSRAIKCFLYLFLVVTNKYLFDIHLKLICKYVKFNIRIACKKFMEK